MAGCVVARPDLPCLTAGDLRIFVLCGRHHSIRSVENDPKLPRVKHGGLTVPPYGAEHAKLLKMAARTQRVDFGSAHLPVLRVSYRTLFALPTSCVATRDAHDRAKKKPFSTPDDGTPPPSFQFH